MRFISVCKNVLASNNKRGWVNPDPAIRLSKTAAGVAAGRGHEVEILDKDGAVVARIVSSTTGDPVLKCGAKVAIICEHDARIVR